MRLVIKNVYPIREIDLELKRATLLIGPQASGKSTVAKALFHFMRVPRLCLELLTFGSLRTSTPVEVIKEFIYNEFWPSFRQRMHGASSLLEYEEEQWVVSIGENMPISLENDLEENLNNLVDLPINQWRRQLRIPEEKLLFISADRAALTNLKSNPFDPQQLFRGAFDPSSNRAVDIMDEVEKWFFGKNKNHSPTAKPVAIINNKNVHSDGTKAEQLVDAILKGAALVEGGIPFENQSIRMINASDEVFLPDASSGQRAAFWMLLSILRAILTQEPTFLILEEPELHLFPEEQKRVVALLAHFLNANPNNRLFLTTHSPYILTAWNNHLYAAKVGKKHGEKVAERFPRETWLQLDETDAFFLEQGKLRDIVDRQFGQILADNIDGVSEKILDDFGFFAQLDETIDLDGGKA